MTAFAATIFVIGLYALKKSLEDPSDPMRTHPLEIIVFVGLLAGGAAIAYWAAPESWIHRFASDTMWIIFGAGFAWGILNYIKHGGKVRDED